MLDKSITHDDVVDYMAKSIKELALSDEDLENYTAFLHELLEEDVRRKLGK